MYILLAWVMILPGKYVWIEVKKVETPKECWTIAKEYKLATFQCLKEK